MTFNRRSRHSVPEPSGARREHLTGLIDDQCRNAADLALRVNALVEMVGPLPLRDPTIDGQGFGPAKLLRSIALWISAFEAADCVLNSAHASNASERSSLRRTLAYHVNFH
ncbi:hypothetical protein [Streptomyces mayonensis]|uniref:hypothetical protein n=1 Tax=Streptomyces mayonensis TaxID=2750816 RepID=UPI001C1DE977|nr:hypothetical protein [Streptomyces sp. A108]MBU6529674.1 hypothetical protein [Streptomyces sp. A108]